MSHISLRSLATCCSFCENRSHMLNFNSRRRREYYLTLRLVASQTKRSIRQNNAAAQHFDILKQFGNGIIILVFIPFLHIIIKTTIYNISSISSPLYDIESGMDFVYIHIKHGQQMTVFSILRVYDISLKYYNAVDSVF